MNETPSTLDMGFRGEGLPPLTRDAESRGGFRNRDACAWHTSIGPKHGSLPRRLTITTLVIPEGAWRLSGIQTPGPSYGFSDAQLRIVARASRAPE